MKYLSEAVEDIETHHHQSNILVQVFSNCIFAIGPCILQMSFESIDSKFTYRPKTKSDWTKAQTQAESGSEHDAMDQEEELIS